MAQPSTFEISSQHLLRILPHALAAGHSSSSIIQLLSTPGSHLPAIASLIPSPSMANLHDTANHELTLYLKNPETTALSEHNLRWGLPVPQQPPTLTVPLTPETLALLGLAPNIPLVLQNDNHPALHPLSFLTNLSPSAAVDYTPFAYSPSTEELFALIQHYVPLPKPDTFSELFSHVRLRFTTSSLVRSTSLQPLNPAHPHIYPVDLEVAIGSTITPDIEYSSHFHNVIHPSMPSEGPPVFQLYDHLFGTAYALLRIYIASITPDLELATWPYRHDPDETWSALPHHSALATHYLITHPAWCSFYSPHHPPASNQPRDSAVFLPFRKLLPLPRALQANPSPTQYAFSHLQQTLDAFNLSLFPHC